MGSFDIAVAITLKNEGGFQDIPTDRGNWTGGKVGVGTLLGTNMGISGHEFPALNIKDLTPDQACMIYKEKYWNPMYAEINDQLVCNKLFDLGVLFGVSEAVVTMQKVLQTNGFHIITDGVFGTGTLMAVNKSEPHSLLIAYQTAFVSHALQIASINADERSFINDYIRRINS